jgi:sulfoacetaldehyde acetyltransferase
MMLSSVARKAIGQGSMLQIARSVTVKCTASEALVETLAMHKVKNVFGIVGSAFIDPLDLFPAAGIEFVDVTHVSKTERQ